VWPIAPRLCGWCVLVENAGPVVPRDEEGTIQRPAMPGGRKRLFNEPLSNRMHGHETSLHTLALHSKMHHTLTALHIAHPQLAESLPADAVIEEGGQDRPVTDTLERVLGGTSGSFLA